VIIKDDVWLKILPRLNSYRCLSRMINHVEVESSNLKLRIHSLLLFKLKVLPITSKGFISLVTWLNIP
jgi:hypothetical protein